jgi:hypothetical protein
LADAAPERYACEVCGREFKAKIALFNHAKTHDLKPGEGAGVEPDIKVKRAPKLSQKELEELQTETAENIRGIGGLLHAGLLSLKVLKLQQPDAGLRVPGTKVELPLPRVDTHLPYVLISRSELTAKVLIEHAAENETLLKWVVRINGWLKGSETGQLVGAHVVGAAATLGVGGPVIGAAAGALIGDVLEQVEQENRELRHQVAQLQAQVAGQAGGWRAPEDERGAGNRSV